MARDNPPKSTNWSTQNGTRQPTKKHELEQPKWHEATHQKARTGARKVVRGNPPKSTNWSTQNGTRQVTKKHKLGTRKVARGNSPKSTNWSTQNSTRQPFKKHKQKHAKWHEATHQQARTGARKMPRGNPPKARGTAAERSRRSDRWKIDFYKSYHSSSRLPVPKKNNLLCAPFRSFLYGNFLF